MKVQCTKKHSVSNKHTGRYHAHQGAQTTRQCLLTLTIYGSIYGIAFYSCIKLLNPKALINI